ncbi:MULTISPECIES: sialidase family protein [Litoreibacter]|uniref:sialidase family protein n=1 Tax=Litoreibacter TaxID=947567 RepID=UPI001FE3AD69|nr:MULTISPECIES: sialidase family protein [Litoreibacter]
MSIVTAFVLIATSSFVAAEPLQFVILDPPVGLDPQEPTLFALNDGRVVMSWTEPDGDGFVVKMTVGNFSGWTEARTIVRSNDLFINWADFPSIAAFPDGTLAAHWLQEDGDGPFAYDVNIALSADEGRTWSAPIVPHQDGTQSQHGFATLMPITENALISVWLDARAYKKDLFSDPASELPDAMQLRATQLTSDGILSEDILLDAQTCSCCQTSATVLSDGDVLVAYRDRTDTEIRDISVVRLEDGQWSKPSIVHKDNWKISGCPVNGPAIDALGETAVVAWYTAANDTPAVKVAFSKNGGRYFDAPMRIDLGEAAGRVDALMLNEQTALITWVEWQEAGEVIFACQARIGEPCGQQQTITVNTGAGSVNFPRMVQTSDGVYLAWTQPAIEGSEQQNHKATVRVIFARF